MQPYGGTKGLGGELNNWEVVEVQIDCLIVKEQVKPIMCVYTISDKAGSRQPPCSNMRKVWPKTRKV